jgi:ATP-dependent RNA helicase DeaD
VSQKEQPPLKIDQTYFEVRRDTKLPALLKLLSEHQFYRAVVFCNTKYKVDGLVKQLAKAGYPADGLHGGKTQSQRNQVMNGFRKGKTQLLVATDVAARGLDVDGVEAVVNFDFPREMEFYIHRIGRTGRAGRSGQAFTFVESGERRQLKALCRHTGVKLTKQEMLPA